MKYNKVWNKRRQQKLLQLNKEGKSVEFIRNYFGSLLDYHPNKKYCPESFIISKFQNFTINNESIINKFNPVKYTITKKYSFFYNFKTDYILTFNIDNIDYVIVLFYYIDNDIISYNILFTIKRKYDEYLNKIESFLEDHEITDINSDMYDDFAEILETPTKFNKQDKLLNAISYIIVDFYKKNINNIKLSIGTTQDKRKINWYRHIIKYSFDGVKEFHDIDNIGNDIYYYDINNIKIKNRKDNKL